MIRTSRTFGHKHTHVRTHTHVRSHTHARTQRHPIVYNHCDCKHAIHDSLFVFTKFDAVDMYEEMASFLLAQTAGTQVGKDALVETSAFMEKAEK